MLHRAEIEQFMPHRPPMLLLDSLELVKPGEARGRYHVRGDEAFLQGHFPGRPIVPGVVLCEIIAQTAGILVKEQLLEGRTPLFVGLERVRFRRMVKPGDDIHTQVKLLRITGQLIRVAGQATVQGELAASGEFLLMLAGEEE